GSSSTREQAAVSSPNGLHGRSAPTAGPAPANRAAQRLVGRRSRDGQCGSHDPGRRGLVRLPEANAGLPRLSPPGQRRTGPEAGAEGWAGAGAGDKSRRAAGMRGGESAGCGLLPKVWPAVLALGWICLAVGAAQGVMTLFSFAVADGMEEVFASST